MAIKEGDVVSHSFVVDDAMMKTFQQISGDSSRIHTDAEYARSRGFDDVIVFGGLMLAQLSHVVGMKLPGPNGTSAQWSINYRKPLYVNEPATITLTAVSVSKALGLVEGKFTITSGEKTVATGKTQSMVPIEEIDVST